MSFVEFLLEYYLYIMAVLVVLIVGVIGFLVDSKNKERKAKNVSSSENINDNATQTIDVSALNGNLDQNNAVSMNNNEVINQQPTAVAMPVNGEVVVEQPQMVNSESLVNSVDSNNGFSASNMGGGTVVEPVNVNNGFGNVSQNVEPVMPEIVNVNNEVNSVGSLGQNLSSNMSSVGVNLQNGNMATENSNVLDQNVNSVMNNGVNVNQGLGSMLNSGVGIMDNNNQSSVIGGQNLQPIMQNQNVNSVPVQAVQTPVDVVNNQNLVENVVSGNSMVSNFNSNINNVQGAQSMMQDSVVNPLGFEPVINNNSNFMQGNSGMMGQEVQSNVGIGMNQNMVANSYQNGLGNGQVVQNTYGVSNPTNNTVQGNGAVVTSDGAQPFDISSMFANNK